MWINSHFLHWSTHIDNYINLFTTLDQIAIISKIVSKKAGKWDLQLRELANSASEGGKGSSSAECLEALRCCRANVLENICQERLNGLGGSALPVTNDSIGQCQQQRNAHTVRNYFIMRVLLIEMTDDGALRCSFYTYIPLCGWTANTHNTQCTSGIP